jgi:hypothetical protein
MKDGLPAGRASCNWPKGMPGDVLCEPCGGPILALADLSFLNGKAVHRVCVVPPLAEHQARRAIAGCCAICTAAIQFDDAIVSRLGQMLHLRCSRLPEK